jgi:hypothetical protein
MYIHSLHRFCKRQPEAFILRGVALIEGGGRGGGLAIFSGDWGGLPTFSNCKPEGRLSFLAKMFSCSAAWYPAPYQYTLHIGGLSSHGPAGRNYTSITSRVTKSWRRWLQIVMLWCPRDAGSLLCGNTYQWYKTYTQIPISTRKLLSYIHSHRVYIPLQQQLTDAIYVQSCNHQHGFFTLRVSPQTKFTTFILESV